MNHLPPLRALHAFEVFGRVGSVAETARELGVTPGAISQQLKVLENFVEMPLVIKDGRGARLSTEAQLYHQIISEGFERFHFAQQHMARLKSSNDLAISGLPSLMIKWLSPKLDGFHGEGREVSLRLDATHQEPDRHLLDTTFRLTYGHGNANRYAHRRVLFTDDCFPACSPEFLLRHPELPENLALWREMPLIEIDWGIEYRDTPKWHDWFRKHNQCPPEKRPSSVFSLSSQALQAAIDGQGIVLAQRAFAQTDLSHGRLVKLSPDCLLLPEPYYVCWGDNAMNSPLARDFLPWLLSVAQPLCDQHHQKMS